MARIFVRFEDDRGGAVEEEIALSTSLLQAPQADMARPQRLIDVGPLGALSERELEVLRLLGAGLTLKEIGRILCIEERTARTHASNIYSKLGVGNAATASTWAKAAGLITMDQILDIWQVHRPNLVQEG